MSLIFVSNGGIVTLLSSAWLDAGRRWKAQKHRNRFLELLSLSVLLDQKNKVRSEMSYLSMREVIS